ncbi:hypothetical protein FS749_003984 [Ceratobasidium sp. UAMH 11750]|nr:hypothetical protein FS749_003984 [Ceratobasidium sp. UAMH 11750]
MPPSIFRSEERLYMLERAEEWDSLDGRGKAGDETGELFITKDQFIDNVLKNFFKRFPECDLSIQPNSRLAFTQDVCDTLHSRIKKIFYNNAAKAEKIVGSGGKSSFNKFILFTSMFKQKYGSDIMAAQVPVALQLLMAPWVPAVT